MMQYILSELELQELQDKAMAYDEIRDYIDKMSLPYKLDSCIAKILDGLESLM